MLLVPFRHVDFRFERGCVSVMHHNFHAGILENPDEEALLNIESSCDGLTPLPMNLTP